MLSMKIWWRFGAARDPLPSLCCGVYRRCTPLVSVSGSSSFSLDALVLLKPPVASVRLARRRECRFQLSCSRCASTERNDLRVVVIV